VGRKTVLFGFWLLGYILGFLAWLVRKPVFNFIASFGLSSDVIGALVAGLAGAFLMLIAVIVWSAFD
jgi:hypothetical protein